MNTSPPVSEVEIANLLRMSEKATGRPWKPCTAGDACKCGLIWSVPADVTVAITHVPEDDEEIRSEVNDNNRYIVAAANLAPRLAEQLRAARSEAATLAFVENVVQMRADQVTTEGVNMPFATRLSDAVESLARLRRVFKED